MFFMVGYEGKMVREFEARRIFFEGQLVKSPICKFFLTRISILYVCQFYETLEFTEGHIFTVPGPTISGARELSRLEKKNHKRSSNFIN